MAVAGDVADAADFAGDVRVASGFPAGAGLRLVPRLVPPLGPSRRFAIALERALSVASASLECRKLWIEYLLR